ncbi:Protein of unknown function (DUF1677 [Striga hermonthica]|uniref:DUF1677 family protein n=1 Tax=Striga hermonthica TaxID=68872 RepID=A0A9N7RNP9_STRHE|nr:Protein of unknown function (DUF1677 [Striga hermonthica]
MLFNPLPTPTPTPTTTHNKPPKLSIDRTISDISMEFKAHETLIKDDKINNDDKDNNRDMEVLPAISEVEDAECECCGMSEECTPEYVRRVREKNCGRMVCGLCSEAVKEEMGKNGGSREEAVRAHVRACAGFNRVGRAFPVLCQAEAMREILRNSRAKSLSPRDRGGTSNNDKSGTKCGILRSSSCIPAISKAQAQRD